MTMEQPPSSRNSREMMADSISDDPLSQLLIPESYIIVTRSEDVQEAEPSCYYACACGAQTGPVYLGKFGQTAS